MNINDTINAFDKAFTLFERLSQPADESVDQRYREGHQAGFWKGLATCAGAVVIGCALAIVGRDG